MARDDLSSVTATARRSRGTPRVAIPEAGGGRWFQVDVFGDSPLSGNGVAVFPEAQGLDGAAMLALTRELRQFEAIFLTGADTPNPAARIFTQEEELAFAGHPMLGAAAVLHHLAGATAQSRWKISLAGREVGISTRSGGRELFVEMDQGEAVLGDPLPEMAVAGLLDGLGLEPGHRHDRLPAVVASTGLPYAILPVTAEGLATARIRTQDFEARLAGLGAKFLYLLDPEVPEGRSWDNQGRVEDIATGSAAGPAAALLWRHGGAVSPLTLRQGRFTDRPSEITVRRARPGGPVLVGGQAFLVAEGRFLQTRQDAPDSLKRRHR